MKFLLKLLCENRAQISAEMIIVLAALIGIAIVVIRKLTSSTEKAANKLDEKSDSLMNELDNIDANG